VRTKALFYLIVVLSLVAGLSPIPLAAQTPPAQPAQPALNPQGPADVKRLPGTGAVGTLWENGEWDGLGALLSTEIPGYGRAADDFLLDTSCPAYTVERIRGQMWDTVAWEGALAEIYADSGGNGPVNDPPLYTFPSSSYEIIGDHGGTPVVEFTFETPGFTLPPGHYWLSVASLDWAYFPTAGNGAIQLQEGYWKSDLYGFPTWTTDGFFFGYPSDLAFDLDGGCAEPNIVVNPTSLSAEQCADTVTTQTLQVCNNGTGPLEWSLAEQTGGKAAGGGKVLPEGADSRHAPAGYAPRAAQSGGGAKPLAGTALILKDANAWGSTSAENILAGNGIPYEVHGSAEFGSLDFGLYGMIYFSCDQPQGFYDAYAGSVAKFEQYVQNGGFLAFCAADQGWNGGVLTAPLPGGMTYSFYGESNDWIDDPAHPTMAGVSNPFNGSWASHGVFANLPAGAHIIAHGESSGAPVTVEYGMGSGWFIGLAETLEISYDDAWQGGPILPNTLLWGYSWGGAPGIPWLSETPTSGTVLPGECQDVTVTFDSTGLTPGTYLGGLLVNSNDPDTPQVYVPVSLTVLDPVHDAGFSWTPEWPIVGDEVTFTGMALGSEPISYAWDFGDGGTATGNPATHTYAAPGDYVVTMTVTNACGQQVVQHTITVAPAPQEYTLHLWKTKMAWAAVAQPYFKVVVRGFVHDQAHARADGVTLTGFWTYPDGSVYPVSKVTDGLGRWKSAVKVPQCGLYRFEVTGLAKPGYAYNPGANETNPQTQILVPCK
jgi:PKD repeat protein